MAVHIFPRPNHASRDGVREFPFGNVSYPLSGNQGKRGSNPDAISRNIGSDR